MAVILTAGALSRRGMPPLLAELSHQPHTERHQLGPLTHEGSAQLVRKRWLSGASDEVCRALHESAAGNPFLIDELCALLDAEDAVGPPDRINELVPPAVAEWARALAANVDERAPALLTAVGVLGPQADLRHAATIAQLETETAAYLVDELVEVGFLRAEPSLTFVSPVVAAALDSDSARRAARELSNCGRRSCWPPRTRHRSWWPLTWFGRRAPATRGRWSRSRRLRR